MSRFLLGGTPCANCGKRVRSDTIACPHCKHRAWLSPDGTEVKSALTPTLNSNPQRIVTERRISDSTPSKTAPSRIWLVGDFGLGQVSWTPNACDDDGPDRVEYEQVGYRTSGLSEAASGEPVTGEPDAPTLADVLAAKDLEKERLRTALEPFAALARKKTWADAPGETGPSLLDTIEGKDGTGELYVGTHFGTERYATLYRDDFEQAEAAFSEQGDK